MGFRRVGGREKASRWRKKRPRGAHSKLWAGHITVRSLDSLGSNEMLTRKHRTSERGKCIIVQGEGRVAVIVS
jgi:hypothetical protein